MGFHPGTFVDAVPSMTEGAQRDPLFEGVIGVDGMGRPLLSSRMTENTPAPQAAPDAVGRAYREFILHKRYWDHHGNPDMELIFKAGASAERERLVEVVAENEALRQELASYRSYWRERESRLLTVEEAAVLVKIMDMHVRLSEEIGVGVNPSVMALHQKLRRLVEEGQ